MELMGYVEIVERLIQVLQKEYEQALKDGTPESQLKRIQETLEDLNRTIAFLQSRSQGEKPQ